MPSDVVWDLTEEERQIFSAEAEELVQVLEKGTLALERGAGGKQTFNEMFRAAHTLKGNAGLAGYAAMASHTHELEQVLDQLRSGATTATPDIIEAILKAVDRVRVMLQLFISGESDAPAATESSAAGMSFHVSLTVDAASALPAVRLFQAYQAIGSVGTIEHADPGQDELVHKSQARAAELVVLAQDEEDLRAAIAGVSEITSVRIAVNDTAETEVDAPGAANRQQTIRVRVDLLDRLMNLVGELVIDRSQVGGLAAQLGDIPQPKVQEVFQELTRTSVHLERVTLDLQEVIMRVRMLPIANLFGKFPRMVRDIAHRAGKDIELLISGQETELDRMVMDQLGDPLTHILRNAIDHGIEAPEVRRAAGKPSAGKIQLRASTEEGQIIVEISDDGRGIDAAAVRRTAIRRGVITAEQGQRMSDPEIRELIFAPGFSTADQVTEISGRGVGLDAVRASMEQINGSLDIDTEVGRGTVFRLQIPLTLAIMRSLLVGTAGESFALPLNAVHGITEVTDENLRIALGKPVFKDRGEYIEVVSLRDAFRCPGEGEERFAVVVGSGRLRFALLVGDLLGEHEIVLKSFGTYLGAVQGMIGTTILANGDLIPVIDVRTLLHGEVR